MRNCNRGCGKGDFTPMVNAFNSLPLVQQEEFVDLVWLKGNSLIKKGPLGFFKKGWKKSHVRQFLSNPKEFKKQSIDYYEVGKTVAKILCDVADVACPIIRELP